MATTVVTNKIYKAGSAAEVAVKPKTVVAPAPIAVPAVLTTTYVPTTIQAAPMVKVKTTNPVIGKAKY